MRKTFINRPSFREGATQSFQPCGQDLCSRSRPRPSTVVVCERVLAGYLSFHVATLDEVVSVQLQFFFRAIFQGPLKYSWSPLKIETVRICPFESYVRRWDWRRGRGLLQTANIEKRKYNIIKTQVFQRGGRIKERPRRLKTVRSKNCLANDIWLID